MKYQIFEATHELENEWDNYVNSHALATPYHLFAWQSAINAAYQFPSISWVAKDAEKNIVGLLPSAIIGTPLIGKKLSALPYCDAGGVLADSPDIAQMLLEHALAYGKNSGIAKFEHRTIVLPSSETSEGDKEDTMANTAKVRMVMPLPENAELLLASFKSKLRSQIRKAEKNGLTSSTGNDQQHLDGFYQVYSRNMRDLGSPAHSKKWFEQVLKQYGSRAIVGNVYKDDTIVGAGIVLFNNTRCAIPWASTNADFNRLAPNMLLYWNLLAYAANNGAQEFDFGRSTPGEGTYKFKKQWGASPIPLQWDDYLNGKIVSPNTDQPGHSSSLRTHVENIWRKLPVSMATYIGSRMRKYISL